MFKRKTILIGMLTATFAVGTFGSSASAQNATIDASTLGAALALPWETDPNTASKLTIATVTNGLVNDPLTLHVTVLDEFCGATNFDCPLTPSETTSFVFSYDTVRGTSRVQAECSRLGVIGPDPGQTNDVVNKTLSANRGVMFVSVECQKGSTNLGACPGGTNGLRTKGINALLGDATIADFGQGFAYSVNAIHIQAGSDRNNGDRLYKFDGREYKSFPSALATNFVSPSDTGIAANLALFTLDFKANDPQPIWFALDGDAYDEDENPTSGGEVYDCYANNSIEDIFGYNVLREESGSLVGHLELLVSDVGGQVDANETSAKTGDANGNRVRPVHGWLVQFITDGAEGHPNVPPFFGSGAWARTLVQGTHALVPSGADVPALNAGPPVL